MSLKKKLYVIGILLSFLPIFLIMMLLFSVASSGGATEETIANATKDLDVAEYYKLGEEFGVDWDIAMLCDMFRKQQGKSIDNPLYTILEFCQVKEAIKNSDEINYYIGKKAIEDFLEIELSNTITLDEINKRLSEFDTKNTLTFEVVEDYESILKDTFNLDHSTICSINDLHENKYLELIYKDELEESKTATVTNTITNITNMTIYANGMSVPHYLQYDSRWGSTPYSCGTVRTAGCGPTSMAMVASYLTGKTILPNQVANWSTAHGHASGAGSYWSLFPAYAANIGHSCTNLGKNYSGVINALQQGKPVIASMAPGLFTRGGHFIVLRGITSDGKILVNDPNDNFTTKNFYSREFNFSLIYGQAKNFWCFY